MNKLLIFLLSTIFTNIIGCNGPDQFETCPYPEMIYGQDFMNIVSDGRIRSYSVRQCRNGSFLICYITSEDESITNIVKIGRFLDVEPLVEHLQEAKKVNQKGKLGSSIRGKSQETKTSLRRF